MARPSSARQTHGQAETDAVKSSALRALGKANNKHRKRGIPMNATTTPTVYSLPEQLCPPIEFLPTGRYHLFVDGRWTDSFRTPDALMQSYRAFADRAHACTVVTGGQVDFYCRRRDNAQ
jgi:hypothetical protein